MKMFMVILTFLAITGCSVFGQNQVEIAPYTVVKADPAQLIEVRHYDSMILVSAAMTSDGRNSAFRQLFRYISGYNEGSTEIAMTAPVLMAKDGKAQQGTEIAMTAPVFMDTQSPQPRMSFVMPKHFTLANTPKPKDPTLQVTELKDYKVAAIQFSGTLNNSNVAKHTRLLQQWINEQGYRMVSAPVEAGYNGPMTLPMLRRNEILIEIR